MNRANRDKKGRSLVNMGRIISTSTAALTLLAGMLATSSSAWATAEPDQSNDADQAVITPMKKTDIDPRVVKTVSAKGCTARIIEFKGPNSAGGVYTTYHRSTISSGKISGGTEARAHLNCIAAPDRYTSWARSGETWESGSCKKARSVSIQLR